MPATPGHSERSAREAHARVPASAGRGGIAGFPTERSSFGAQITVPLREIHFVGLNAGITSGVNPGAESDQNDRNGLFSPVR